MVPLSLSSKMSVLVSLLAVCFISLMAWFASAYFETHFKRSLADQQSAMVASVAGQLDDKILTYRNELVQVARTIPPGLLADRGMARNFLEGRLDTRSLFDSGLFIFSPGGEVIAGAGGAPVRPDAGCPSRAEIKKTAAAGTFRISDPFFCHEANGHPIVMFTAPVFGAGGKVAAVLAGALDLTKDNFLGRLARDTVGGRGYYYIFNDRRVMLLHPDRERMLTFLPAGRNTSRDKALAGFEGTEENVNAKGVPVLSTFRRLKGTNWILSANYPLAEAYAPLYGAKRTLLTALFSMGALFFLVAWVGMRHLLAPLVAFTAHVRAMSAGADHLPAVHIRSRDEIEELAMAFNQLMADVGAHKNALREEKAFEESLIQHSSLPTFVIDACHRVLQWNRACEELTGILARDLSGTDGQWRGFYASKQPTLADFMVDGAPERAFTSYTACREQGDGLHAEGWYPDLNGKDRYLSFYAAPIRDGEGNLVAAIEIVEDITERKRAEESLRKLSCAVEQSPNAVVITGTDGNIEYVNPKFTALTGYRPEEVLGKNPRILQSGETSPDYFRVMWETISIGREWRGEFHNRKKDGELYWEAASISPVKNDDGLITHYVAIKEDITEHKLAEKQIQQTFSLLSATLESTVDGILVRDLDRHVIAYNRRFVDMWRIPPSVMASHDDRQMRQFVSEQLKEPDAFMMLTEELYVHPEAESDDILEFKDGRVFERVSKPQVVEDGIVGRVISFRDITKLKRAEVALSKVNRALWTLSSCNQSLVYAVDEEALLGEICLNIVRHGGYRFAWVGYAADGGDKAVRPVARAGHEEGYLETIRVSWADTATGNGPTGMAIRTGAPCISRDIASDETFAPWRAEAVARGYHSSVALPLAADGTTFGALTIYSSEVDAFDAGEMEFLQELASNLAYGIMALRMRDEHRRAEEALRESAERYRSLVENIDLGVSLIDDSYRIVMANEAIGKMLGKPTAAVFRKECFREYEKRTELCVHCPGTIAMATGKPATVQTMGVRDDGSSFVVKVRAFPVYDPGGKATRFIEVVQDITEQVQAENEKMHLEEQLRQSQKFEAIGTLAGGIAHDFNNFLTVIMSYCTLMERKTAVDDPLRNYIAKILAAAERAASLTRSLLAYSRKQAIDPRPVDLSLIIEGVDTLLSRLLGEDIELSLRRAPGPLTIMADSVQIEQVLMNLATNARDAMPQGGILQIETRRAEMNAEFVKAHGYGAPGAYALLVVSDTGKGIGEDIREKIFEPFFTTKDVGKGTGLGLSMVYGIVKQHNGYINVYSEPGQGSTFRIYLPLTDAALADAGGADLPGTAMGRETLLLVEDDREIRTTLKELLEHDGYTIIEAVDGDDGIRKFNEHLDHVSLVLLDIIMPKKNGREVYEAIRAIRPATKAIFISGYTADILSAKGILQEDVNLITKPIAINVLSAKIREVLKK